MRKTYIPIWKKGGENAREMAQFQIYKWYLIVRLELGIGNMERQICSIFLLCGQIDWPRKMLGECKLLIFFHPHQRRITAKIFTGGKGIFSGSPIIHNNVVWFYCAPTPPKYGNKTANLATHKYIVFLFDFELERKLLYSENHIKKNGEVTPTI
jgi:hypothetical protein